MTSGCDPDSKLTQFPLRIKRLKAIKEIFTSLPITFITTYIFLPQYINT